MPGWRGGVRIVFMKHRMNAKSIKWMAGFNKPAGLECKPKGEDAKIKLSEQGKVSEPLKYG